ncbi:MAG: hypothetical protein K8S21_05110 [Gemmatimonadetes bacterium]|nr:hypothetical protein [Gemmatimonadota bacterium]
MPFIGTALGDTVRAGPGTMRPIVALGHSGRGQPREIFGQRVHVDRVGGRARRAFPAGATDVVLVPWDFDASCQPVTWGRSALWLAPGTAGLFSAELRDREHWVDGLPTFDVMTTAFHPYPIALESAARSRSGLRAPLALLTAEELLRFFDALPPRRTVPDSLAALADLRRLAADPELAVKYPVTEFLRDAQDEFQRARLRAIRVPIAGTFQLVFERVGGATTTAILRIDDGVSSDDDGGAVDGPGLLPPVPRGYFVQATAALSAEELDADCTWRQRNRLGYVGLAWHGPAAANGSGDWLGSFDERIFEALMPADSLAAFRARRIDGWRRQADSLNALGARFPDYVPNHTLRFEQRIGERMRVSGEATIDYLGTFRVSGERISLEALACDR